MPDDDATKNPTTTTSGEWPSLEAQQHHWKDKAIAESSESAPKQAVARALTNAIMRLAKGDYEGCFRYIAKADQKLIEFLRIKDTKR